MCDSFPESDTHPNHCAHGYPCPDACSDSHPHDCPDCFAESYAQALRDAFAITKSDPDLLADRDSYTAA